MSEFQAALEDFRDAVRRMAALTENKTQRKNLRAMLREIIMEVL